MKHLLYWWHGAIFTWRHIWTEESLALFLALFVFVVPVNATRLQERGLFMHNVDPGATTSYTISFNYMSPQPVGSINLRFCYIPIPTEICTIPPTLDVSNATLSDQTGETGFSILSKTRNNIVLTRVPTMISSSGVRASYTLSGIVNPTDTTQAFSIRLETHDTTDASGPVIDFGSVRGKVGNGIQLETQVPPMLMFCLARQVSPDCEDNDNTYYSDMGELSASSTLTAKSEMAVGTNASSGFVITANGDPLAAGTNVIDGITTPSVSKPGTNQFGINLVENTSPAIGHDPEGTWLNAVPSPDYGTANMYKYVPGDVVASAPDVSLMRKFTVSYIVNSSENLRAGVYTTTITYIASGRF